MFYILLCNCYKSLLWDCKGALYSMGNMYTYILYTCMYTYILFQGILSLILN